MRRTTILVAVLVFGTYATNAIGGDLNCPKELVRGIGLDQSLPCWFHPLLVGEAAEVSFEQWSSTLSASAKQKLEHQASVLRGYPEMPVNVVGHIDAVEADHPKGERLGYERAVAVRDYLVEQGVDSRRITTDSRGARSMIPMDRSDRTLGAMRFVSTETADESRR